jgi:hypothetical protein
MPIVVTRPVSTGIFGGQIYYIIFLLVAIFVTLSTFVSLYLHEAQGGSTLHNGGKIIFLSKRQPIFQETINNYTHLLARRFTHAMPPPISVGEVTKVKPKSTQATTITTNCSLYFPSKCKIHPLVHYWDDESECYVSPLREHVGLSAKNEDRKFVVFQPDLGGWNNIRMALEVVIVFAKVQLRVLAS